MQRSIILMQKFIIFDRKFRTCFDTVVFLTETQVDWLVAPVPTPDQMSRESEEKEKDTGFQGQLKCHKTNGFDSRKTIKYPAVFIQI